MLVTLLCGVFVGYALFAPPNQNDGELERAKIVANIKSFGIAVDLIHDAKGKPEIALTLTDEDVKRNLLMDLPHADKINQLTIYLEEEHSSGQMVFLSRFKNLKTFRLGCQTVKDDDLAGLINLVQLQELDLGNTNISNSHMKRLVKLKNLRVLHLEATKVSDEGLKHISQLSQLRELHFHTNRITDNGLEYLKELKHLEVFGTSFSPVTDDGLKNLVGLPLKYLYLPACGITGKGMIHIKKLKDLTHLNLDACGSIDDAAVKSIVELTNLIELRLCNSQVSDRGVAYLKPLINLRYLALSNCDRITDAGLKTISSFGRLENLEVDGTEITDAGLDTLKCMSSLYDLNLEKTLLTPDGVKTLKSKWLTNVNIRYYQRQRAIGPQPKL